MKLSEKLLRNYKYGLYSVCRNNSGCYAIFSTRCGPERLSYSDKRVSLEEAKMRIGYYTIALDRIDQDFSEEGWKIVDTMQPWQTMGTELLPVGTYVEILVGDTERVITKVTAHTTVGGILCYELACDNQFYYGRDDVKPVLSKWFVSNEVEDAIALLKREGIIKDGQILTTL